MTPCQQFKAAFLIRCQEAGLNLEQTHELVKQALVETEKQAAPTVDVGGWFDRLTGGIQNLGMAGLALPVAGGLLTGKLHGMASTPDEPSAEELNAGDLVESYRRAAMRARMQAAIKQRIPAKKKPGRSLML